MAKDGIITRGVLVDVPMIRGLDWMERGAGVMPQDIEEAERRCGFRVEEGDVLIVRTGQLQLSWWRRPRRLRQASDHARLRES